ncbi:Holliday junction resolvase RuvX [Pararhodospirillum photometricum]|uniref:Putative pre-16S rRNA nuclease n=1 Tax=Pararhodospirillum photometricum DSM 122 TaxID=1150469 RepID=H6SPH8_PARPM|nr:Holliday junction resolvase RuvX [Pararhodospirillum photometricum]CCG09503.1 Putative Holliday junction resolvase [Pararhodospirillum photometricum DSM 122]
MPQVSLPEFLAALPRRGALLGFDLGTRTIGVAACDVSWRIATPVTTVRRTKFGADAKVLQALIDERGAVGLVLGLPVEMDGSQGSRCQSTRAFAQNFLALRDLPLVLWDERLSTAAVERFLVGEADLSRAKRAQVVDRAAAAYILQGALDALARLARSDDDTPDF